MPTDSHTDILTTRQKIEDLQAEQPKRSKDAVRGYFIVATILSDLIGGLLVGGVIGYALYRYLDWPVIVFGVFTLLGGIAGLLNMYRSLSEIERKKTHA